MKNKIKKRCLIWAILYTLAIILIFFVLKSALSTKIYYGHEFFLSFFFHWANNNKAFLVFLVLSIGYFAIILIYFKKTLKHMDEILNAMEEIYTKDDEPIFLSRDLEEVNEYMNRIKFNLKENERIARESEKRKEDLIVYLAHDLKTPLTSILGYLNILKEEEDLSERFRKKISTNLL